MNRLYIAHERDDRENPRAKSRVAVLKNDGEEIAVITITGYKVGEERSQAEWATLFAAAPELLEALRAFSDEYGDDDHDGIDGQLTRMAKAAIAKATGAQ